MHIFGARYKKLVNLLKALKLRESILTKSCLILLIISDFPEYFNPKLIVSIKGFNEAAMSFFLCNVFINIMIFIVRKIFAKRSF